MRRLVFLLIGSLWVWAGCAPPPTPFPAAIIPTPTVTQPQPVSPTPPFDQTIALLLDTRLPPLDDPAILALVTESIDPAAFAQLLAQYAAQPLQRGLAPLNPLTTRTELANLGYPDGLALEMAGDVPGIDQFAALLRPYGLEIRLVESDTGAHLVWRAERAAQPPSTAEGQVRIPVILLPAQAASGAP